MKKRILKSTNALLAAILALFGISSCDSGDEVMYGVETSEFIIVGTITNEESAPIKDIQVFQHPRYLGQDTAYTDANGNFRIVGEGFQGDPVLLLIDDVDGDANGSFQSDTAQGILTRNTHGYLSATINKTLKEKTE